MGRRVAGKSGILERQEVQKMTVEGHIIGANIGGTYNRVVDNWLVRAVDIASHSPIGGGYFYHREKQYYRDKQDQIWERLDVKTPA